MDLQQNDLDLERRLRALYREELGDEIDGAELWERVAARIDAPAARIDALERSTRAKMHGHAAAARASSHLLTSTHASIHGERGRGPAARLRAFASVMAALVVIAMGAAVFTYGAPYHRAHPIAHVLQPTHVPAPTPVPLPHYLELYDVLMLSVKEGWAVGMFPSPTTHSESAIILHYTGGQWQQAATFSGQLYNLSFDSLTDGWASGYLPEGMNHSMTGGLLVHYTGEKWMQVPSPLVMPEVHQMFTPDSGYMTGLYMPAGSTQPVGQFAVEVNGKWTVTTLNPALSPAGVSLTSPSDGWATGDHHFWRYHDGRWTETSATLPAGVPGTNIQMVSENAGWVSGDQMIKSATNKQETSIQIPFILHYDGTIWAPQALPGDLPQNSEVAWPYMTSPDEGWVVVVPNGPHIPGCMLHYLHGTWIRVPLPKDVEFVQSISSVSATEAWGIGYTQLGIEPVMVHYLHGTWTEVPV